MVRSLGPSICTAYLGLVIFEMRVSKTLTCFLYRYTSSLRLMSRINGPNDTCDLDRLKQCIVTVVLQAFNIIKKLMVKLLDVLTTIM
jgi:hypothetical protein